MPPWKDPAAPHASQARRGTLQRSRPWLAAGPCMGAAVLLLAACSSAQCATPAGDPPPGAPALTVQVLADGLDHPWDAAQAPDGTLLFAERAGGLTAVLDNGRVRPLDAD